MAAISQEYTKQATDQYDPQYNAQVNSLKSSLANKMAGYDQQKVSANQSYDGQVKTQNLNNTLTKNNYNNEMLRRGAARSTIATTGFAGLDDKNTRIVGGIEGDRTNYLNGIDTNIQNENVAYNNNINQLAADRQSQIAALARQLYESDRSYNLQASSAAAQAAYYKSQSAANSTGSDGMTAAERAAFALEKKRMDSMYNDGSYGTDSAKKLADIQAFANNGDMTTAGQAYAVDMLNKYKTYLSGYKAPAGGSGSSYAGSSLSPEWSSLSAQIPASKYQYASGTVNTNKSSGKTFIPSLYKPLY